MIVDVALSQSKVALSLRERHGIRYRGNAAVTAVITAGMGTNQENRAVIPREIKVISATDDVGRTGALSNKTA